LPVSPSAIRGKFLSHNQINAPQQGRGKGLMMIQGIAKTEAAHNPAENSNQSEFLLACLRAASLRAKLIATELDSVGVALRHNLVSHDGAVEWLHDFNLLDHVLYQEFIHDQI
jgi:hypothetical protein